MSDRACARTELLIGRDGVINLAGRHVLVAGLGGVGGHCAEALARAGVGSLTLVDHDRVSPSNLNRQLLALGSTIGRAKVEVMAERLADIDPELNVVPRGEFISRDNAAALIARDRYDMVADCIDTVACKVALIAACLEQQVPVISSLGAGGRIDPSRVRLARLNQTHGCGLARTVRKRLKERGLRPQLPVIFSDEPARAGADEEVEGESGQRRSVNGTISYMPAMFGLTLASAIIRGFLEEKSASETEVNR